MTDNSNEINGREMKDDYRAVRAPLALQKKLEDDFAVWSTPSRGWRIRPTYAFSVIAVLAVTLLVVQIQQSDERARIAHGQAADPAGIFSVDNRVTSVTAGMDEFADLKLTRLNLPSRAGMVNLPTMPATPKMTVETYADSPPTEFNVYN